jgi:hypothetical protein
VSRKEEISMRILAAGVCLAAFLSACAPSQTAPPPVTMAPGQYRTTVTFTSGPGTGDPPLAAEQCISAPLIDDLINDSIEAGVRSCSENTIRTANGLIQGRAVCTDDYGFTRTMDISGTYGNSRADMDLAVRTRTDTETIEQRGRVTIERVGEC